LKEEDDLVIEKVGEQNFEGFFSLVIKLAEYEKLSPPDDGAKARLLHDAISDEPKYHAYIGKVEGKPVAYLIYFFNYSSFKALPTLYIEDIFVLKEYRRKGFGTKMYDICLEDASKTNCGRMEWCVLTWNEPAIRFYEKMEAKRLDWYFYRAELD